MGQSLRRFGAVAAMLALAGCGDLTRSEAERILNSDERKHACVSRLTFIDGGFEKAKASGALSYDRSRNNIVSWDQGVYKIADLPDGDRWEVIEFSMGFTPLISKPTVIRRKHPNLCFHGKAQVTAIADAPFGLGKSVEFVATVSFPSELEPIRPYVYTGYEMTAIFQKTDLGWRVVQ